MKWIEIITLRSLEKANKQMVDELLQQLNRRKKSGLAASIGVYHHPTVETDLSIHINWDRAAQHPGKSPLGEQIANALKGLGLLSYSIWVEVAVLD